MLIDMTQADILGNFHTFGSDEEFVSVDKLIMEARADELFVALPRAVNLTFSTTHTTDVTSRSFAVLPVTLHL
jgi:hypothetical protein